jgi:hypothetical protein
VDVLGGPVLIANLDFAEVVLRKLARQALKPHQRRHAPAAERLRQRLQGRLSARVPREPRPVEQLDRP